MVMVVLVVVMVMILVISLPGILHLSYSTGLGEDHCGDGCDGGGVVDGDDDTVDKIARCLLYWV